MKRYIALALPSVAAISIGLTMVIGWHVSELIEPEILRTGVRIVASTAWIVTLVAVFIVKSDAGGWK